MVPITVKLPLRDFGDDFPTDIDPLKVGDYLKVAIPGERFWVKIVKVNDDDGSFYCTVENQLVTVDASEYNGVIHVHKNNILDIEWK